MTKYTLHSKPLSRRIIFIAGYVIVSLMIIGGCLGLIHTERVSEKYDPTSAKIEEIKIEQRKSRGSNKIKNEYQVIVSYQISGTTYRTSLGHYNSSWKTGDTIVINYDPENPNNLAFISGDKLIYIILIVVGAVTLVSIWGLSKLLNKIYVRESFIESQ